jgi:hypothetical protein
MVIAAPLASHFSCWRRSPGAAPPAQRLAGDEGQREEEDGAGERTLDGAEPAHRVVYHGQAAGTVDADRVSGEGAGDRYGRGDQLRREKNGVDPQRPPPEPRTQPSVREQQD